MKTVKTVKAVKAVETAKTEKAIKADFITANNIKVIAFNADIHGKLDKQQIACGLIVLNSMITGKADISLKLISCMAQVSYYKHNASAKYTADAKHNGNRIYLVNGLKGMTDKTSCHNTWTGKACAKLVVNAMAWSWIIKTYSAIHGTSKAEIINAIAKARQTKNAYVGYADIMQKAC